MRAVTEPTTVTTMTDGKALYQLMTWLSPSYPVGAYTYSHGLEHAIDAGWVLDRKSTEKWIRDVLAFGDGFADAVMLKTAHQARTVPEIQEVAELALAFVPTAELALESEMQGGAFLEITRKAWPSPALDHLTQAWSGPYAYPVVVGVAALGAGIPIDTAVGAYLHAFAANLVSAAVRLIPLGQTDGQLITAALADTVQEISGQAKNIGIDNLATSAILSDIASMKHETQYTRLFRS